MLKTIRLSFRILAFMYVCLTSLGVFQFELIAVSNQVFRYCSASGCVSQKFLRVLFANILSMSSNNDAKIYENSQYGNIELNSVSFGIVSNVWRYETCRISEPRSYQPRRILLRDETLDKPLKPLCFKTACWQLPFILWFLIHIV